MLLNQLFEKITRTGKGDTAVVGWGRGMGHKGHMMLASSVITKAKEAGGDPYFVVSRTVGKDDPITPEEKLAIYKKVFPEQGHIFQAASDEIPDLTKVLANLNKQGYKNAVVVVGADQVKAFQYLKNYNGKPNKAGDIPFEFDNLEVISRQETNDPSAGEEGPRATPMRDILKDPKASEEEQFAAWRDAMSPEVSDDEVRDLMNKAKTRMGAFAKPKKEGMEEDKAGWSIKGSPRPAPKAPTPSWRFNKDGTYTDLNTGITYKRDGSVVKKEEGVEESATAGATSAGNIASVEAPHLSPGNARGKKSYIGDPMGGRSGTKAPPQPKVKQPKKKDGTAKNALDMKNSIFGENPIRR